MKSLMKYIEKFLEWGTMAILVSICIVVAIQVIGRYIFKEIPFWTEEVSRFLFVYLIAFGSGLVVKHKGYVNLDVVSSLMSVKVQKVMALIVNSLVIGFMAIFFMESLDLVQKVQFQRSPVLGISMSFPYASMLGIGGSVLLFLIVDSWEIFCSLRKGGDVA